MGMRYTKPVARNFYWGVLLDKCGAFWQNSRPFLQHSGPFWQNSGPFYKIVDLLFREGVLQHLENPPGCRPDIHTLPN